MDAVRRFSEVLEGYLDLGSQLLNTWTPYVEDVSTKVDAGTYQAADAANDAPKVAKLVAESWTWIGAEAIDAVAILTGNFSEKEVVIGYQTDLKKAAKMRTLALKGNLKSVTGLELPAASVTVAPATLAPNVTAFTLSFDGDGFKARTYDGHVVATDEDGVMEEVFVSVTIG
ncbi:MAG: hypothetical protein ACJ71Z_00380 [Aeromicrobium sp.]